jgi:hypothetical protein
MGAHDLAFCGLAREAIFARLSNWRKLALRIGQGVRRLFIAKGVNGKPALPLDKCKRYLDTTRARRENEIVRGS